MKIKFEHLSFILAGVFFLTACSAGGVQAVPTVNNSTSPPIPTQIQPLPTSIPKGQTIIYKDLRMTMKEVEISASYMTEYGSKREPPSGIKFLWVEVQLENTGPVEKALPKPEHFSVVYGKSEFKSSYGHRQETMDYTALKPVLYQGQKVDGWLRFDVPMVAELDELKFAFLPESLKVDFSLPTSGYSWADHPEYFWQCK